MPPYHRAILICLIVCVLFANQLAAQSNKPFAEIDKFALAIPESQTKDVRQLAKAFLQNSKSDLDKVRAVYTWITYHISYDWETFQKKSITDQSATKILQTRFAVCEGYANLFKAICDEMRLPCEVVSGYVKGIDYRIGMPIDEPNHSWNAVKIGGKWFLIDTTWGANDKNNRLNDYYFLPAPEKLIYTHFPEQARWQLLPVRLTMYEFERKLLVYPSFFDIHLSNFNHKESLIETSESSFYLTFNAPPKSQIAATLSLEDNVTDLEENISKKHNLVNIRIDSLATNLIYELNIYGASTDSAQMLDLLMTYYISTGKDNLKYVCNTQSDFKLDSLTQMPYWFMYRFIEYAHQEEHYKLEKLLQDGIILFPKNKWLFFRLGDLYEKLNITEKAILAYQKAIDLSPDYYEPHYNLGVLYYNQAIDVYDSWRKLNPEEDQSKKMKKELVDLLAKAKPHVIKALTLTPEKSQLEKALRNINHFVN
ncbi:MAG: tetratricopeptide repeat protein [Thermoflexibacter sp.]|jgi:tetratricopeptide (TPR) repeat protein|nr:tetratricopeptide repeat protein [Thermoflexibacter sp.]